MYAMLLKRAVHVKIVISDTCLNSFGKTTPNAVFTKFSRARPQNICKTQSLELSPHQIGSDFLTHLTCIGRSHKSRSSFETVFLVVPLSGPTSTVTLLRYTVVLHSVALLYPGLGGVSQENRAAPPQRAL